MIDKKLIMILPSEASMAKNEEFGLLTRWKRLIDEYKLYFDEVEIYTCDKKDFSEKLGIKHHPCKILIEAKYLKAISYNFWLLVKIRTIKASIIRFFGSVYPLMPLFQFVNKTPKILSYQYDFYMKTYLDFGQVRGKIGYWAEKYSVLYIGNILTTTYELQNILKQRYNVQSTVNPNFVNLDVFYPSAEEQNFLFFAGRIFYTKGIDMMIEMILKFNKRGLRLNLFLAGDGDLKKYQDKINYLDLNDQIKLLGPIPAFEVAKYMRKSKVFIFPTTTQEGHPKSLIEALASGAACVASRVLGNTEIIQDKENGLIIEPCDLADLMEKVELILNNDEFRSTLKRNAVISSKKFDIKQVVKYEVEVLNSIML